MFGQAVRLAVPAMVMLLASYSAQATQPPAVPLLQYAQLVSALKLQGELFHVQGVELDGPHLWVTSVDTKNHKGFLHEFDRVTGILLRRLELTDGVRYHPGGISIQGRSIWVPVAEMGRTSSTVLVEIDADSMQIRRKFRVADHLGCVAAAGRYLIAGNWDSRLFYIFDLNGEDPVRVIRNPSGTRYQDMKYAGGQLVGSGPLSRQRGRVDWLSWPSMTLNRTLQAGAAKGAAGEAALRSYAHEGMAIEGRELYFVAEDGPSRLFHFRLDN